MVATDTPEIGCERVTTGARIDSELARLIEAWPKLSDTVRVMIRAAVDAVETDFPAQR